MKWYFLLLLILPFFLGCLNTERNVAINRCVYLCQVAKASGENLSEGPCLSDGNPNWNVKDWVCDVAHSPRQAVDNKPENQCQDYRQGFAHHFVEVDENCEVIRAI